MDIRKFFRARFFLALLGILVIVSFLSCRFCPLTRRQFCQLLTGTRVSQLTSSNSTQVFEDPGTIIVFHGSGCAESRKSGTQDVLRVEQSVVFLHMRPVRPSFLMVGICNISKAI